MYKQYCYLGRPGKHRALRDEWGIHPKHSSSIDQLYEARSTKHCNARSGYRFAQEVRQGWGLPLIWPSFDLVAIGKETGVEKPISQIVDVPTREPTSLAICLTSREKKFKAGEWIKLEWNDLPEICYFFSTLAIPAALASFLEFLKENDLAAAPQAKET